MADLQHTPLYELHRELGAKMTAFAGYAMPVQYGKGIIHEHLHCRVHAGLFDISHMGQCRILGQGAAAALERLTPGGIVDLAIGGQKYTLLTHADGGVMDDIVVTRTADGVSLIVNAGCKEKDFAYLRSQLPLDAVFEQDPDSALLALQGPEASAVLATWSEQANQLSFMHACSAQIAGMACTISRSGYTGEDGFEISVPRRQAEQLARLLLSDARVEPIGLGARDTLRLEAGLCLYGHELSDAITPIEARLQWLFKKGHADFPGAGIILEQKRQGAERLRVGLLVDGRIPLREGCELADAAGSKAGRVTSGSFSPSLNRPIAMALVRAELAPPGVELTAMVRDQVITATVCALPFIPHRYRR